jgi:hypothetical protein
MEIIKHICPQTEEEKEDVLASRPMYSFVEKEQGDNKKRYDITVERRAEMCFQILWL